MSQLIRYFPIKPIQLAFLLILVYFWIYSWAMMGILLVLFALFALFRNYELKKSLQTLGCLLCFGVYFLYCHHKEEVGYKEAPTSLNQLQIVPDTISVNGDLLVFRATSARQTYQVYYTLKSKEEQIFFKKLNKTMLLQVQAKAEEATPKRNFQGFDYRSYLKREGIYRLVNLESIVCMRTVKKLSFAECLHDWRRKAIVSIQDNFPSPMQYYMTGLLFGYLDKSFDEMSTIYSSLGIIHLFALSGMQVGFFLGIFRFIFLRIGLRRDFVNIIQLPFSLIYAGLTGFSVSVIRSLIQSILANLGIKCLDNFAVTVLALFIIMPNFLLTTGGVLSFAYAFILSFVDYDDLSKHRKIIAENMAISLGVLPVLTYFFATFQPMSIFLTMIFSLAFDIVILPMLSIIFLLSPFVKVTIVNNLFKLLETSVTLAGDIFSHPLVFGKPSLLVLVMMLICLGFLYDFCSQKRLTLIVSFFLISLFCLTKTPLQNEVTVVDIGQGDSILLRDIRGKTILIDVGGKINFKSSESWRERISSNGAERTLIPYLKSRGISKIDQLVLTHTDTDHIGDMEKLSEQLKIGEVLVSSGSLSNENFAKRLGKMQVKVCVLKANQQLPIMNSCLQALYARENGDGSNNDSIILYGNLLGKRFLFTGDLEKEGEVALMSSHPQLQVDILKVGHHGSKGSSSPEFLHQLTPDIALISAGQNNRYKHPHQETLERFKEQGIHVYRTDQQGAIRFVGLRNWRIETVR